MKLEYWLLTFLILGLCSSCSQEDSSFSQWNILDIVARDEGDPKQRPVVYRIKVPQEWIEQNPLIDESIMDTTKAIMEFFIYGDEAKVRIAIHNFPSNTMDQRILPMAQINRWKKQFQSLDETSVSIIPQAFGGYYGFLLEATGQMDEVKTSILAWSLQLAMEHYQALSLPVPPTLTKRHRQMRGDVTIKAVGPQHLIAKHRERIISSARSFQLIDDIHEMAY